MCWHVGIIENPAKSVWKLGNMIKTPYQGFCFTQRNPPPWDGMYVWTGTKQHDAMGWTLLVQGKGNQQI